MKIITFITSMSLLFAPTVLNAAAPNDISTNQRAWFDGVDINGNNNYTDNPANNSAISQWTDKSGSANHVSSSGSAQPLYRHNSIATDRHGVDFDGSNDTLVDASDIWTGSVSQTESFVVATTDVIQSSSVFNSTSNGSNRLGIHLPWSNSTTYFDQGNTCCGNPMRLFGNIPITLSQQYFWHIIGLPAQQSVVQDGRIRLNDSGAGTYNTVAASVFTLGGFSATNARHNGRVFEGIFYQTELNNAQRRIISSYLSAKWNKAFSASPTYADVYIGDNTANGDYDFFVGGIGQDNGTQTTGTSQGLTITDNSFLTANGKYITAGVNYLLTTPTTGTTTTDLPTTYINRSNRSWYIDRTGNGGLVNLSFNATSIGIPVENGARYGLLHRTGTSGVFTEVATATMSGGVISFSHLPADGVYTIGIPVTTLTLVKNIDNTGGGSMAIDDFDISIDTTEVVSGVATTVAANTSITISELDLTQYAEGSWSCVDANSLTSGLPTAGIATGTTLNLLTGSAVTCTISNNYIPLVDLSISKSVNDSTPNIGDTVTFTLIVLNSGPDTATFVTVNDILPAGFSYVASSITGGDSSNDSDPSGAGLNWTIDSLALNASTTLTFQAVVNPP